MAASRRVTPDEPLGVLGIVVTEHATTTTISLQGECDLAQRPAIREAVSRVLERSPERVVLDLSCLNFIDSVGIHAIIELHRRSEQQCARLVIVPGGPQVQRTFELLGLTAILPFLTEEAAVGLRRER